MRYKWIVTLLGTSLALTCLVILPVWGQNARGSILGHIQDPSGAAVPNAKVTVRNQETSLSREFTTDPTGDYVFPDLLPGKYDLSVQTEGFKTATSKSIVLDVDQKVRQDFALEVGAVTEEVTVVATTPMLQTSSAAIGTVVGDRYIHELPLNGRDFRNLIAINAGVAEPIGGIVAGPSSFGKPSVNDTYREQSINGARPASVSYLIDGITNTEFFFTKAINLPPIDTIEEFKLQNGLYSSEYGSGSAQVNLALKSGTNSFHGTAYDFVRNDIFQPDNKINQALNARNPTATPLSIAPPPLKQNQFGFTAGGPIRFPKVYDGRNRSFFFVGYEGARRVLNTGIQFLQVPTAQEKQGNFSDWPFPIYDPSTTRPNPSFDPTKPVSDSNLQILRDPFPGKVIDPTRIDSIARNFLQYFPTANLTCSLPCPNYTTALKQPTNLDNLTARVDNNFGKRDQLVYTMIISRGTRLFPSAFPASSTAAFSRTRMFGLEWQRSISPNTINSARFGYNREFFHNGATTGLGPNLSANAGLKNTTQLPQYFGIPLFSLAQGYNAPGQNNNGYFQKNNIFEWVDNLKHVHGRHTLTLGADIRRLRVFNADGFVANGILNFTGAFTALNPANAAGGANATGGNGFADLLLGDTFSVGAAPAPIGSDLYDVRATEWSFFAQDDFRVTPRLTFNLGLRYELPGAFHSVTDSGAVLNLSTPDGGLIWASQKFVQNQTPSNIYLQCCVSNQLVPTDKRDWSPRVGFAWRPLAGNNKLVFRGGYGVFYDIYMRFYDGQNYDDNSLNVLAPNPNYPVVTGREKVSPAALSTLWLPPITVDFGTGIVPPFLFGVQTEWPKNRTPFTQQWSFDVQYAITPTALLDVGYVGSHGSRLPIQWSFNEAAPPTVAGDPCNFLRDRSRATGALASCLSDPNFQPSHDRAPFKNFSTSSFSNANILMSNYNSLQVRLEKRFSHGLQFMSNYTWSKTLDEVSEIAVGFPSVFNQVQNARNLRGDYGPASFDEASRFVFSYYYELPVGKGKPLDLGKANWFLGGWGTSGIVTLASGLPITVTCCPRAVPGSVDGGRDQMGHRFGERLRANVNADPRSGFTQTLWQWFNTSVFSTPTPGTYGNSARGILRTDGQRTADLSLVKNTRISERYNVQYRLEIFNFLSSGHQAQHYPVSALYFSDPATCTPGLAGNCFFGSIVPLNGLGALNFWNPRIIQMALKFTF